MRQAFSFFENDNVGERLRRAIKYRGLSMTGEYSFRNLSRFRGNNIPDLFDHGFWLLCGKFVIPEKLELLGRF
ncbi:hypothetical protein FF011L_49340 [Roseimaritima multifibrata]|uniref:Uncharacterized protein n=1 Tax=Roseimaritima multifibrata TaxID=1930274 RepID=A0A517MMW9_9BACT|nr:hypothetical protein [Roseimaritima multifibrata]QDS96127.1 hypothetical protein FF011L_49340 [Roseimaritima multifibrata]